MGIRKHMRVGKRETSSLRQVLLKFPPKELASQPLPRFDRTDDRYELLNKFQALLQRLGFAGVIVLMDRVDEPHMTGGKPELMRRFVWPMLDNKLLKHPGLGFKMMLPQELHRDVERENREFHERARLDKQNVIPAFQWTGESLYDLARARMLACASQIARPSPGICLIRMSATNGCCRRFSPCGCRGICFGFFIESWSTTATGTPTLSPSTRSKGRRSSRCWRCTTATPNLGRGDDNLAGDLRTRESRSGTGIAILPGVVASIPRSNAFGLSSAAVLVGYLALNAINKLDAGRQSVTGCIPGE